MKKILLTLAFFSFALVFLPSKTQAQYTSPYIYTNNAYLNYAIASSKARAARNRAGRKSAKKYTHRKSYKAIRRHRGRRVAILENLNYKNFIFDSEMPKKSLIG